MRSAFGDFSNKLEKHNIKTNNLNDTKGALRVETTEFVDRETKVTVNPKEFLDINKDTAKLASQIEDIKKFKYLEEDIDSNIF